MQKDAIAKAFLSREDVLADMVNALLGKGAILVRPCDVKILKQEHIRSGKDGKGKLVYEMRISDIRGELHGRDIGGKPYWMRLCVECQSTVVPNMPVRCTGYEVRDMEGQLVEHLPKKDGRRLIPTLSIVANVSGKPWKAPLSLDEMYACRPDFMEGVIMKNRAIVFDPFNFPKGKSKFLLSDLKYVVDCPDSKRDPDVLFNYLWGLPEDLPEVTAHFICMLKNIPIPEDYKQQKEGETFMCYATRLMCERKKEEGRLEGRMEGVQEGRQEGRQEEKADVFKEALRMGLPKKSVQRLLKISPAEYQRLLAL